MAQSCLDDIEAIEEPARKCLTGRLTFVDGGIYCPALRRKGVLDVARMGDARRPEVFISKRGESDPFLTQLNAALVDSFRVLLQSKTGDLRLGDEGHKKTTKGWAKRCQAAVVLIGPSMLSRHELDRPCYQSQELEAIWDRLKEMPKDAQGAFPLEIVLLQNEKGHPTPEQLQKHIRDEAEHLDKMFQLPLEVIRDGVNPKNPDVWEIAISKIVASLERKMRRAGEFKKPTRAAEGAKRPTRTKASKAAGSQVARSASRKSEPGLDASLKEDSSALTEEQQRYLRRSLFIWISGRGSDNDRTSDLREDEDPFAFRLERFINLLATGSVTAAGDSAERPVHVEQPVLTWLLTPDLAPMALVGDLASGKTVCLATAAAALAARCDPKTLKPYCRLPNSVWADTQDIPDIGLFPILIDARTIEQVAGGPGITQTHVAQAMAQAISGAGEGPTVSETAVIAALERRPLALFVDGFDGLASAASRQNLAKALNGYSIERRQAGGRIRIVVAARPFARPDHFDVVTLGGVNEKQREAFFESFAQNAVALGAALDHLDQRFRREAQALIETGGDYGVLANPATLNLFCWSHAKSYDWEASHRLDWCSHIVDRLTPESLVANGMEWSKSQLKRILAWIAYEIVVRGGAVPLKRLASTSSRFLRERNTGGARLPLAGNSDLVETVRKATGFFELTSGPEPCYQLRNSLFGCYLAAQNLVERQEEVQYLEILDPDRSATLTPFLSFVRWEILAREGEAGFERALEAPRAMLEQAAKEAKEAFSSGMQEQGLASGDWAVMAATSLKEAPPTVVIDAAQNAAVVGIYSLACQVYREAQAVWRPAQRCQFLSALAASVNDPTSENRAEAVHALFDTLLGADRFVGVEIDRNGAKETLHVASRPLLVADYRSFLSDPNRAGDDFLSENGQRTIDQDTVFDNDYGIAPEETWLRMRGDLGAPMTDITWFEAVEYCRWLTRSLQSARGPRRLAKDEVIRPMTEREFRAVLCALAGNARYPWGTDERPRSDAPAIVNIASARLGQPSPPGVFAPLRHLHDFATNVATWTISETEEGVPLWPPATPPERVTVCGASFASPAAEASRTAAWRTFLPQRRSFEVGLRFVRTRGVIGSGAGR